MGKPKKLTKEILNKLIQEVMENKTTEKPDKSKFIDVDIPPAKTDKDITINDSLIGTQRKYMEFINELTPQERKEMKELFCYDMFSLDKINKLSLASKGKIDDDK